MMMKKIFLPALAAVLMLGGAVFAARAAALTTTTFSLEGKPVCCQEATLGNLVADALKSAAGTDMALVNASQIRPLDLPAGAITEEQIASALAYPDEPMARITLKGSQVRACLERGLSLVPLPNKGFLQISGLKVKFDSRLASGTRVTEATTLDGKPLEATRDYKVAMPSSLAKGAGGYFMVLNSAPVETLETSMKQAVVSYVSAKGAGSARENTPRLQDIAPPAPPTAAR
jgi:2',3'-cyclic-nucleotide 2'-phosphodiesterase (5'-nucleotidase family)